MRVACRRHLEGAVRRAGLTLPTPLVYGQRARRVGRPEWRQQDPDGSAADENAVCG